MQILATFVLAIYLGSMAIVMPGTEPKPPTVAYIFLLDPKCDEDMRAEYTRNSSLPTPQLDRYLYSYEIVCFGGIDNVWLIDKFAGPIMRWIYPDKLFVFVFDQETMGRDFSQYLWFTRGAEFKDWPRAHLLALGEDVVKGYSDIRLGWAYASDELPYYAKHELAHLMMCGTWHDGDGRDLQKIQRYPGWESYPWCGHYLFPD